MSKGHNWEELAELVRKTRELGLSLKEGAAKYGVPVRLLYESNRRARDGRLSGGQAAEPPVGEASAPAGRRTAEPPVGEASAPAGRRTAEPPVGEASAPAGRRTAEPPVGEASAPAGGQTVKPPVGEALAPPGGQASDPPSAQASAAEGGQSSAGRDGLGKKPGSRLPEDVAEMIRTYRRAHPDHGFRRIEMDLKRRHLVVVSRKQIRSVLKEAGLLDILDSSFDRKPEPAKGTRRFEASYPGELYQMDVTNVYVEGLPVLYLVVIVDDHSRFCVGSALVGDQRSETMIGVLHHACVSHGRPVKLLTDQGGCFYTWSASQTRFQQYLDTYEIEHVVCEPHSPQTQGKVERLIQTIQVELFRKERLKNLGHAKERVRAYIQGYNYERGHQSLGGLTPSERFYGVAGETARVEARLLSRKVDAEKGFVVLRLQGRTLSVVCGGEALEVYLDGKLLRAVS